MTAPTVTDPLAYPGPDLADLIPGGWVKRASVSPSRLPRLDEPQRPCPCNGQRRHGLRWLTCTAHLPGRHVVVSLGRVLAVWEA